MQYTEGEWLVHFGTGGRYHVMDSEKRETIADIPHSRLYRVVPLEEQESNAVLISKAPKLVEGCNIAMNFIESLPHISTEIDAEANEVVEFIKYALPKQRG